MNETIFRFLNDFALRSLWLDTTIIFSAQYLGIILIVLFIFFYLFKFLYPTHEEKGRLNPIPNNVFKTIYMVLFSAGVVWFLSQIINNFYPTPRPFLVFDDMNLLFEHGGNDSFPSGHATFLFTIAFMSYFYGKRLFIPLMLGALIVGVARVIAGVHWPVDILGAFILAMFGSILIWFIVPKSLKLKLK